MIPMSDPLTYFASMWNCMCKAALRLFYHPYLLLSLHQVQVEDVENEDKRYTLFQEMLAGAQKWEDFQLIMLLLQAWPPMMKEEV